MVVTWNAEKYQPIGHCIYCGCDEGQISDEHIIPFGLLPKGGDWFLPKASCGTCADITKGYEGACQQAMLGPLRYKLGLKSRRKQSPDISVTYNYREGACLEDKQMSKAKFPFICIGFKWPAPGLLRGLPPSNAFEGEAIVRYSEDEVRRFISDGEGFKIGRVGPLDFARMLAKIGHSYIVAKYGEHAFTPMLTDLIRERTDIAPFLVGGDASGMPVDSHPNLLHHIYRQDCRTKGVVYVLATIQLFAFIGMPRYHVVVGQMR